MTTKSILGLLAAAALMAATGCTSTNSADVDAAPSRDAAIDAAATYFGRCGVHDDYGDMGALDGLASREGQATDIHSRTYFEVSIAGDDSNRAIRLGLRLEPDQGVFADGIVPGRYPITGPEVNPGACSVCVWINSHPVDGQCDGPSCDMPEDRCYFAKGGTVTLTETEQRLTGSFSDVTFRRVRCDLEEPVVTDECTTAIQTANFEDDDIAIDATE